MFKQLCADWNFNHCLDDVTNLFFLSIQVYDGKGTLEEGETAEARFIKIQAAYELLIDEEKRREYDRDNRVNPMKVKFMYIRSSGFEMLISAFLGAIQYIQ